MQHMWKSTLKTMWKSAFFLYVLKAFHCIDMIHGSLIKKDIIHQDFWCTTIDQINKACAILFCSSYQHCTTAWHLSYTKTIVTDRKKTKSNSRKTRRISQRKKWTRKKSRPILKKSNKFLQKEHNLKQHAALWEIIIRSSTTRKGTLTSLW